MNKEDFRQQASISILNSLLETTPHSVIESLAIKDIYAHVAIMYADALINALELDEEGVKKWIDDNFVFYKSKIKKIFKKNNI